MRRREVHPSFFTSEQVSACSVAARLLFAGLWCLADRAGLLLDDPWRIRLAVFPTDRVNVDSLLGDLEAHHLIVRYQAEDGRRLVAIPTFAKWQRVHPHEVQSRLPAPLVMTCNDMSLHVTECTSGPSVVSGPSKPSGNTGKVFDLWREVVGKPLARLTPKRERVIRERLKDGYDEEAVCDAVRGVAKDPWPERVLHNDLTNILKDGEHLEKFRDLWRNPPAVRLSENPIDKRIREFGRGLEVTA